MELSEIIKIFIAALDEIGIEYFITGSVASISYGEPRFTNDVDVIANIKVSHVKEIFEKFSTEQFYLSEIAIMEAIQHRSQFNIIHGASGFKIDVIVLQRNPFDQSRMKRVRDEVIYNDLPVKISSPEDVILMKMKYYQEGESEKHVRDIHGVLSQRYDSLDLDYINEWSERLGVTEIWKKIQEQSEARGMRRDLEENEPKS